jgi:nicotinate-nucleotide adenylyltransferase
MRLGIYGGTFDPVHYGHLLLAEQCREQLRLDAVWFMPAAVPPHKQDAGISSGRDRLAMLELATAGHPALQVSDRELRRGGTSYTVETLTELRAEDPQRELYLLIGGDSLAELPTWRQPQRILELAIVAAVNRGRAAPDLAAVQGVLGATAAERIVLVSMPAIDLSATDMRRRAADGRSLRYMTPRAVEEYIRDAGLYRR